jgi:hypothetical protein
MASILAAPAAGHESEVLSYKWRLQGFTGALAGMFLPNDGSATLSTGPEPDGMVQSELHLTADSSPGGEFWRYGARLDPRDGRTLKAWSTYLFRGERKSKEKELGAAGTIDIASGIYLIRRDPPKTKRAMRIWSDGKEYPVEVVPRALEWRKIAGRQVPVRRYSIIGVVRPGERLWKGSLDLWLTQDEAATPVEILVERGWAAVRLKLVENR